MRIFSNRTYFHPNIGQSLLLSIVFMMVFGTLLSLATTLVLNRIWPGDQQFVLKTMLAYIQTFVPALCWISMRSDHLAATDIEAVPEPYDALRPMHLRKAAFFPLVIVLMIAAMIVLEPISYVVELPSGTEIYFSKLAAGGLLSYITLALLPAILEEFIFRGTILRGLLHHQPPYIAIILSAFLFAFIHMNLAQGLNAFLMGCLIGWIYYRTHSFIAAMLMHLTNNSLAFLTMLSANADQGETLPQIIGNNSLYAALYAAALIVVAGVIYLFAKRFHSPTA